MRSDIDNLYEHRIVNGVLKALPTFDDPSGVQKLLHQDFEILADYERAEELWPCTWALAAVLARQFTGTIYVADESTADLPAPAPLPRNVVFGKAQASSPLKIGIGTKPDNADLFGDVQGRQILFGKMAGPRETLADPVACFALAGYVGFAALALAVGIPPFREEFASSELELPMQERHSPIKGLTIVGLGQLGQAYLALLFFCSTALGKPRLTLIDKDRFEAPNFVTQILLGSDDWEGSLKTDYLGARAQRLGFDAEGSCETVSWEWKRRPGIPSLALLGLDSLDVRRMCVDAGFEWLVEAGVGTSFLRPRVTWHSLPPNRRLGQRMFSSADAPMRGHDSAAFALKLKETPGQCGWVSFNNVNASAPSLGLVAAAYAISALLGGRDCHEGSTYLWSPLLPYARVGYPSTS